MSERIGLIRAGCVEEIDPAIGYWIYVDPGFSSTKRSCGLLLGDGAPTLHTFAEMSRALVAIARSSGPAVNLVVEAPLSVAFSAAGNPIGRSVERRGSKVRYWYTGLGCAVLVASTHLMRALTDACPVREIRLFEGLVSFKDRGQVSDHCADVLRLHAVVHGMAGAGNIVPPSALLSSPSHTLRSAFHVAGMDYGMPPVIEASSGPVSSPALARAL